MCSIIPPGKDWIDVMAALTVPIIGGIGVYIAYQQQIINKNRLKIELFPKRYAVYEKIRAFISEIIKTGTVKQGDEIEFLRDTKDASILFVQPSIKEFVDELYLKAVDLEELDATLEGLKGEERTTNIQKQLEIKRCYMTKLKGIDEKFKEPFKFDH